MFGIEEVGIPKGLEGLEPGPVLAGFLASIDRDSLSGRDRVLLLRAERRMAAHYEARALATMNTVAESVSETEPELPLEIVVDGAGDEIAAALTLTRRSAESQLDLAMTLSSDYPHVLAALEAGLIDVPKARVLVESTCHLETELRNTVVEAGLERAPGQTTGQLRAGLARLALTLDSESARKRYEHAVEDRRVILEASLTGTANLLGLDLPADQASAAMARIDALAKQAKTHQDSRTIDQVRADVLLDLLTGRSQGSGRMGGVEITVDLQTLVGLSESPGELNGYGPVIADITRQIVADQSDTPHRVTVTENGEPVWTGTTRRRANTAQTRRVQARNRTCVFPGCRMPAKDSDLDHTVDWAKGGPTREDNLAPLCRHHHNSKHVRGWKLTRGAPGVYTWTSPLHHTYTTGPDPP